MVLTLRLIQIQETGYFECLWSQKWIHYWTTASYFGNMCKQHSQSSYLRSSTNTTPKYEHIIAPHVLSTSIFTRIVQAVLCWFKSAQHCLYNSGKDRFARYICNDMFVLWNCNEISSNVMWKIRNEANKIFVRTK